MRVSFFVPPGGYFAERWSHGTLMPALGILYMAAVLEENGVEVDVTPTHVLEMTWGQIARKIETEKPDVVGITTTTENRFLAFELAQVAKRARPETFVLMGGPHFKNTAQDTLSHLPYVDGVCVGEGELTMLDLVRCLEAKGDLRKVDGLSFRKNGEIVHNRPRALIPDLNVLPIPAWHLEPLEKYNFKMDVPGVGELPAANLITSRGCPFNCNFCATPANWGQNVRGLTPQNVVREIAIEEGKHPRDFSWTKKRDKRVIQLPAAQGHVPLYQDRLTWWQISELIFRFADSGRFSLWSMLKKVPKVMASIYSWGDLKRYSIMFAVFCKMKAQRMMGTHRPSPSGEGQPLTCSTMYKQGQEVGHAQAP